MGLRAVKQLVIEHDGKIKIVSEGIYMRLVRNEHFLDMPKILGKLDPSDKSTIEWVESTPNKIIVKTPEMTEQKARDAVKLNNTQKAVLTNMILSNIDFLANKGVNNFVNNFNELILSKI